jgi:hypothetical protein
MLSSGASATAAILEVDQARPIPLARWGDDASGICNAPWPGTAPPASGRRSLPRRDRVGDRASTGARGGAAMINSAKALQARTLDAHHTVTSCHPAAGGQREAAPERLGRAGARASMGSGRPRSGPPSEPAAKKNWRGVNCGDCGATVQRLEAAVSAGPGHVVWRGR